MKKHFSIFQAPSFLRKFEEQSRCPLSLSSTLNYKSLMGMDYCLVTTFGSDKAL